MSTPAFKGVIELVLTDFVEFLWCRNSVVHSGYFPRWIKFRQQGPKASVCPRGQNQKPSLYKLVRRQFCYFSL